ncbi:MAG TPA: hypothetical protein VKA34_19375, partial [Balneolales bacterium]|nr:hypothetical protein [Balneolales bacterium]
MKKQRFYSYIFIIILFLGAFLLTHKSHQNKNPKNPIPSKINPEITNIVQNISALNIKKDILKLVSFRQRQT